MYDVRTLVRTVCRDINDYCCVVFLIIEHDVAFDCDSLSGLISYEIEHADEILTPYLA